MLTEEEIRLKKRLEDLALQSSEKNMFTFSPFLSQAEAAMGYMAADASHVSAWGGYDGAERVILRYGSASELGYEEAFPIRILKAEPLQKKFADALTHRDFLGALMNLGIRRDTVGDILVTEHTAYIMAEEAMASYIAGELHRAKHTELRVTTAEEIPEENRPKLAEVKVICASPRLDAILSQLLHLSRGKTKDMFAAKQVFLNGRITENESVKPKENDTITVRGYGKCIFREVMNETKKGRCVIRLDRYM